MNLHIGQQQTENTQNGNQSDQGQSEGQNPPADPGTNTPPGDQGKRTTLSIIEKSNIFEDSGSHLCHLDIFIYKDTLLRTLEKYERILAGQPYRCVLTPGKKLAVIFANVNGSFNSDGLLRFEAMQGLEVDFGYERMNAPVMSGYASLEAGDSVGICVEPLLSRVILERLDIVGDAPAFGVRATVRGAAGKANLVTGSTREVTGGTREVTDIGPIGITDAVGLDGKMLWKGILFYPPAEALVLEYEKDGATHKKTLALGATARNSTCVVSAELD